MTQIQIVPGKWYVIDTFGMGFGGKPPEPVAGPFDSQAEAEAERRQLNVAEDCVVLRRKPVDAN